MKASADRITHDDVDGATRIWPTAVVVWALASVVTWLRLPAAARDTFWAEDGHQFVQDWLQSEGIGTLFRPYGGYQHLVPRSVTGLIVELVPVQWWAAATTAIACVITGGVAALVFVFSRDVIDNLVARIGLALVVVFVPLPGMELIGNVANSHWYLLYLTPWLLLATPRTRAGSVAMVLLALAVTLTEPQSILFAPLAVWRFVRVPRLRPMIVAYAVGLSVQVVSALGDERGRTPGRPPWTSVAEGYWGNASLSIFTGNGRWTGAVLYPDWRVAGWWVALASLLFLMLFAGYAFIFGRSMVRVAVVTLLVGSVAIWCAGFILNNDHNLYYSAMGPERFVDLTLTRYGAIPSMMLASMVPLACGVLVERRHRLLPVAVVVIIGLVVVMSLNFVHRDNHRSGTPWTSAVADARATCADTGASTVDIETQPAAWLVTVPCSMLI